MDEELGETAVCPVFVFVNENWGKRLPVFTRTGSCPVLVFVNENWEKRPFVSYLSLWVRIGGKRPFVPFFLLWVRIGENGRLSRTCFCR